MLVVVIPDFPIDTDVAPLVPRFSAAAVVSRVPVPANVNAVADVVMVSSDVTPVSAPPVVTFSPPLDVKAKVPVELPMVVFPVPVVAIVTLLAPALARSVAPVDVNVVNFPVDAVDVPIAVLFIPVAVVLKFPDVKVKLFAPESIDEALSPDSANAPDVPIIFVAPVVCVNPFEAVKVPAEVIVPVPEVEMVPEVVTASPAVAGESVVPVLFQKPKVPVVGAVVVKTLEPSV